MKLWDVATGKEKAILSAHIAEVQSLAFSPDGHTLASGSRVRHLISPGEVKLWDVATGGESHL